MSSGEDSKGAYSLIAKDIDKDGDQDLVVASNGNDRVTLWRNDGKGNFDKTIIYDNADFVLSVTAVDFDGDGDLDVASASFFDGHINWYENLDGQGYEWKNHTIYVGVQGHYVSYADVDGDGDDDLIASLHAENTVRIFFAQTKCDFDQTNSTAEKIQKQVCCHVGTEWNGTACQSCPYGTYGTGLGITAKCIACPTDSCVIPGLNVLPATCSGIASCEHVEEEIATCACPVNMTKNEATDACVPCPEGQVRPETSFQRDVTSLGNYSAWEEEQGLCHFEEIALTPTTSTWVLVGFILAPVSLLVILVAVLVVWLKTRRDNNLWKIDGKEIHYDTPPVQLGQGGFGIVYLAEFRGTQVAVKKLRGREGGAPGSTNNNGSTTKRHFSTPETGMGYRDVSAPERAKPTHHTVGKEDQDIQVEQPISGPSMSSWGHINTGGHRTKRAAGLTLFPTKRPNGYALKDLAADMRLLSSLRHPCITAILGAVVAPKTDPLLIMEYVENKALSDLLHKSTVELEGDTVMTILRDISQGLQFLHNTKPPVIHGDIKSHNILLDSKFRAKVTDFGISYKVGIRGTSFWMSPELLGDESAPCTSASDVYSFGITLYEIYARKTPYHGEDDHDMILNEICDPMVNRRPVVPSTMSNRVAALMHDCLVANPDERPSMNEIASRIRRFTSRDVAPVKSLTGDNRSGDEEASMFQDLLKRFPRDIAEVLMDGGEVSPTNHESCTVFVANLMDIDKIALELSQEKALDLIRRWHDSLDKLAQEKQVFKIETAGESWMGVTNCASDQSDTHAKIMAEFALGAVEAASRTMVDPVQPELGYTKIRVGFHSGPLLTNVIGTSPQSARFTLFGDTVNVAVLISHEKHNKPGLAVCSSASATLLSQQAPDTLETSPLDRNQTLYWVNVKGLRASAAYDRIRKKQQHRLKQKKRGDASDSCASSWTSIDTLEVASTDGGFDEVNNEDNGGVPKTCQVDYGAAKDELFAEIAMEMASSDGEADNDDDDMTELTRSVKERLSRNHKMPDQV